ncbi:MAG: LCP family protein [Candidatus Obscuribacterales bacterium]|nr:LCP family protein [Candidatus Obscuribacterales bacterium]
MKIWSFDFNRPMIWQTALAICLGIGTGMIIFSLTAKPQAEAGKDGLASFFGRLTGQTQSLQMPFLPKLENKVTILLMGVDSNGKDADRFNGTRSDTMMLVSIDPTLNSVGVISIPRDSRVHIEHHGTDKINAAHAFGGPELAVKTVRDAFGVPIDHYIAVDTQGLKRLFEILGPVQVLVEKEMHYTDHAAKLNVDLQPGLQTLTPTQAEEYVRFRHDARGDIGRIERQQWFLRQAGNKFKEPQIVLKMPELVQLAYECIRTDLPMQDILKLAAFAKDFPSDRAVTAMLPGQPAMINGGSFWVPDPLTGQAVLNRVLGCSTYGFQQEAPPSLELSLPEDIQAPSAPGLTFSDKPVSVAIRYPRSSEQLSLALEKQLTQAGLRVKYRWQTPEADCQHEQIIQQSVRANDESTAAIIKALPEAKAYPISVAIEQRPAADFVIVLTKNSQLPSLRLNAGLEETQPMAASLLNKAPLHN